MLIAGTKLGPYEIVAPLGAGGMGEVYRARDPRLGREVAIKVVPESVARRGGKGPVLSFSRGVVKALGEPLKTIAMIRRQTATSSSPTSSV